MAYGEFLLNRKAVDYDVYLIQSGSLHIRKSPHFETRNFRNCVHHKVQSQTFIESILNQNVEVICMFLNGFMSILHKILLILFIPHCILIYLSTVQTFENTIESH